MDVVRQLCWEYRDYLLGHSDEVRHAVLMAYGLESYQALMDGLAEKHARPRRIILLAERDGLPVACGMYHPLSDTDAEIKRVYVRPDARGTGTGRQLSQALITGARADGFSRVFLDTSRLFTDAQRLYESLGFRARGAYADLPEGMAEFLVFYELNL
ncbi:GNAT family N-acetyltransferase [Roseobacter ponti]|uniref:GNAT family N-acetyltransferase n=2 Tax=Roseobacter ponti TaxID=1891787 RepID=A0A858SZ55_9RHOB|nr:GNAT family N-acetyltransferase [Roseobacter ponti]